jgi:tRNA 2-selenouridine synthase
MPDTLTESDFSDLFINDIPMLDVRAPIEYQRGSFPEATNLPLLNDDERHRIGKHFKAEGQQAAINLGHKLVSGRNKEQRIQQWQEFLQANPNAALYCFRGGLRSHTVQQWIREELGISIALIAGGYKALRRHLIEVIDTASETSNFMIIGGKTGSGKTHLINALNFSIDLEGLANHRGSAFGRRICPQPAQINFENKLGIALLKVPVSQANHIFLEDESRAIGSLSIPKTFHDRMSRSPMAMLEESLQTRVDTIYTDYIYSNFQDFVSREASSAHEEFSNFLLNSLQRIQRRLGGEKYLQICSIMKQALQEGYQQNQEEAEALHKQWIKQLLQGYYDPMYEYQMNKKSSRIIYRGSKEELLSWASHLNPKEV